MKTSEDTCNLRAGDVVVVRSPDEILRTLDADGMLDGLPFMPEMLEYCGKSFRVLNRVVQTTIDAAFLRTHPESYVREFRNNDVVTLQGVRCSGAEHDHCQRGCAIFWKAAWIYKVDKRDQAVAGSPVASDSGALRSMLRTKSQPDRYLCQASESLSATLGLSNAQRFKKCFSAVAAGNIGAFAMAKRITVWTWWKLYRRFIGEPSRGKLDKTPSCTLELKPGDLVQIKSLPEIMETLNAKGRNRGMHFSPDQRPFCGQQYRVRNRAENFISDGDGEMKHFRDTVTLEEVLCDSACFAFGGCYRSEFLYWHEIWLKRVETQTPFSKRSELSETL